jgi:hypothetical protein
MSAKPIDGMDIVFEDEIDPSEVEVSPFEPEDPPFTPFPIERLSDEDGPPELDEEALETARNDVKAATGDSSPVQPDRIVGRHLQAGGDSSPPAMTTGLDGKSYPAKQEPAPLLEPRSEHPLVENLLALIERYVVMTPEQRLVVVLWIIHTHLVELIEQTPYLTVTSPVRQCGKSRLLELLELLVPRAWPAVTPSEAVVYRTVHARTPTLLLDEVDAIFAPKTADRHEGLRAILNAGHRRGATVPRCIGVSSTPQDFKVYCAKVLAGIGVLPDTITDRSIPIRLARKTRGEHVERFRRREATELSEPIRTELERFAEERGERLAAARPALPEELSDRMQEGCEALLAIADELGCGGAAREALVELLGAERLDERESAEEKLLRDVRRAFGETDGHLTTESLLLTLNAEEPWSTWYGSGLDARGLAAMLRPYGISPRTVRVGATTTAKGYHRADFAEVWERYVYDRVSDVTDVTDAQESLWRAE